jgi:hypothetical protein
VLAMIVVGVAIFGFGIAVVWYFVVRTREVAVVTEEDFDGAYDELVAKGELADRGTDREAAWRDFQAWQIANEEERLSWEEAPDE